MTDMTMVHEIETRIINTLEVTSPISAERRAELVDKIVELIHIEPGTTSDLLHSHITADLALYTLEKEGEVVTIRNREGILELSRTAASEDDTDSNEKDLPLSA
jgi:hypothetical protein